LTNQHLEKLVLKTLKNLSPSHGNFSISVRKAVVVEAKARPVVSVSQLSFSDACNGSSIWRDAGGHNRSDRIAEQRLTAHREAVRDARDVVASLKGKYHSTTSQSLKPARHQAVHLRTHFATLKFTVNLFIKKNNIFLFSNIS
jgi:hypothetical protein